MNLATVIVLVIVAAVFAAIIAAAIRNMKSGKCPCSCGGSCQSCNHACCCEQKPD